MENKNNKIVQHWFLHIDLDAFFASVEQLDHPEYRGKPVIVGGRKDDKRGVVSTASYEARKFGVHSAMPLFQAIKLCPNGIYVRGRMDRYAALSYQIMNIFRDFSPDVEQMSIDEAFVDLTGTEQLFGSPEKTALTIKQRVKEITGLTVSVGLAQTKYLAKIASGYSKPDGFYFIRPGEEENFMLSLPLKKLYGIGPKALERLKKTGINTTRDIYEKPLDLLIFLFGNTMGTFLYNVVRGKEQDTFSKKRKNHSISAETTFPCDITDVYTAETALLELAHGVMFRLLKEEKYSRTVTVKIKYDDFTSVSIQKTLDRNIITLDTFFDTIKVLFEEKYQIGRGIRLLGVGFDKVETTDKPYQQSLFGEKEEKKQAVEKAILNLNKKHPEIKIQKARTLKSVILFLLIFTQLLGIKGTSANMYGEDNDISIKGAGTLLPEENSTHFAPDKKTDYNKDYLYNFDINDKNKVLLDISGQWKLNFLGDFKFYFGKNLPFSFSPSVPIFKQDIELSSKISLDDKWYFEGNFADNFDNNTLTFGYKGSETKYFREGKLSNRNITMPNQYSAEQFGYGLAGGSNQAPGFSAHWQSPSDKWQSDLLIRYDMTEPKSAIFKGMNKINRKIISSENYQYGYAYTFPDTARTKHYLQNIENIFVQNKDGKYKDKYGKTYKKLSSSEYFYSSTLNILYLSDSAKASKQGDFIPAVLITFKENNGPSAIVEDSGTYDSKQSFNGKIQALFKNYDLSEYAYNPKSQIEKKDALIIQNTKGFSPYLIGNIYDCGTNINSQISVISKRKENTLTNYKISSSNNIFSKNEDDFLQIKHMYAQIDNKKMANNQFPFADTNPEIYLNISKDNDIAIQIQTYSSESEINIGQKASTGTIQVFRNNAYDTDFIYDKNTGIISLGQPVNSTDTIKIIWQEEANNYGTGTLSFGMGYFLNILPELNWDISLTTQKPLNFDDSLQTTANIKSSFAAITTGLNYTNNNFNASDKIAFSIQNINDSGKLLVSTQQDFTPKKYNFDLNDGLKTNTEPFINGFILSEDNNCTIKNHTGIKDKNVQGYIIPLQWKCANTNQDSSNPQNWASLDLKLKGGNDLKNSEKLKIKIKSDNDLKNCKLYVQFGIKAGTTKDDLSIPTPIYEITSQIKENNKWQDVEINLSDNDRAKLVSSSDLRIIVLLPQNSSGTIYAGPYTTVLKSISTTPDENVQIFTTSVPSGKNTFSSQISWIFSNTTGKQPAIKASTYFSPADFSQYKTINFKFAYTAPVTPSKEKKSLTIILDDEQAATGAETALELKISNINDYINQILKYHTITVDLKEKSCLVDGKKINCNLIINENIIPSRANFHITTTENGSFYVDNITYEGTSYTINGQNNITANYSKNNILKINDINIFENYFVSADSTQKITKDGLTVLSNLNTGITITNIQLQGNFALKNYNFINAGHLLKTQKPLLNLISLSENYQWNNSENSLNKNNNFNLSLTPLNVPITINSSLSAAQNNMESLQNHDSYISSSFNLKNTSFSLKSSLKTNQNIQNSKQTQINNNYFSDWFDITKLQFSTGCKNAEKRNTELLNNLTIGFHNNFVTPSLSYNIYSLYENNINSNLSDKVQMTFNLPFNFKNSHLSFNLSKTAGSTLTSEIQHNYFADLGAAFEAQKNHQYLYTSIPFYELFDQHFVKNINDKYSTKYEIEYKKQLSNSLIDLLIPSSGSFAVIRDIRNDNNFSDTYQVKTVITNKSINNFGRNSNLKLFNWFNQEELISSITGIVKIPTDNIENTSFQITSYMQLLFMISESKLINTALNFSIETGNNWSTGGTIVYTRPGESTLILSLLELFIPKIKETKFNILRKDSLNFKIGTSSNIHKQEYSYLHSVDTSFMNNFTITSGIGAAYSYLENKSNSISINYSIGGKVIF